MQNFIDRIIDSNPYNFLIIYTILSVFFIITVLLFGEPLLENKESDNKEKNPVVKIYNTLGKASAVHIGDGYFITVSHGLVHNETSIDIRTEKGYEIPAYVVWNVKEYDVAFLRTKETDKEIPVGTYDLDCSPLKIGEELSFIGTSANVKMVRSWGRVATENFEQENIWKNINLVNSTIIPGMSGGAVIDKDENLKGINAGFLTQRIPSPLPTGNSSLSGFSYVIPSETICMLIGKHQ